MYLLLIESCCVSSVRYAFRQFDTPQKIYGTRNARRYTSEQCHKEQQANRFATRENNTSPQKRKTAADATHENIKLVQTTMQGDDQRQHKNPCFSTEPRYQQ
jgi:hypothetical protein